MTKKEIFVITVTNEEQNTSSIVAFATKYEDSQKLYGKTLRSKQKTEIAEVYRCNTGEYLQNQLIEENKIQKSN